MGIVLASERFEVGDRVWWIGTPDFEPGIKITGTVVRASFGRYFVKWDHDRRISIHPASNIEKY